MSPESRLGGLLLRLASRRKAETVPPPLIVELLGQPSGRGEPDYRRYPFSYYLVKEESGWKYDVFCDIPDDGLEAVRRMVQLVGKELDPERVEPLTFERLVEVLKQDAASHLGAIGDASRTKDLGELVTFEAIGLSRILALAKDEYVAEFFVDSETSPLYLDHSKVGRCETTMVLSVRERKALETHMDTFRGYTLDYVTPSLKNDLEIARARLRIALDLGPTAVNRFSLDVRRLNISSFSLGELVGMKVLSSEAAGFLVEWLERGGNVTIVGETGTGKTTLMNALDEQVNPRLRRVYIEDAVETKDLLDAGYHQMKVKVDPFERGGNASRSKTSEIVKVLHRSPDLVILSEIQSEEHSRAFFHALSAGVRGMQTFHASTVEQAIRRWVTVHGIPKQGLLDLGILVQMSRPDRLSPFRQVARICAMVSEAGEPRVRDVYVRDRETRLQRVSEWERLALPAPGQEFVGGVEGKRKRLEGRAKSS